MYENQQPTSEHIDQLPIQHLEEHIEVEPVKTISIPTQVDEITIDVQPTETIPTKVQEITETVQTVDTIDSPQDVDVAKIINNLKKRETLKLFSPLKIQRKVNKIDKTLAVTKSEILTLYKENPTVVTAILKTHLPELFTV